VASSESDEDDNSLGHSIDSCKKAVYYSWFVLFEAEFLEDDISNARKLVSECMIDLAELYLLKKQNYRAGKLLEQAISLNPSDSNLYLYLGKVNCLRSHFGEARDIFKHGLKMAPEDDRFKACLACVYKELGDKEKTLQKCDDIDVYGPEACNEALDVVAGVYNSMKMFDQKQRLENASFLARLSDDAKKGNSIIKCLEIIIEESRAAGNGLLAWKSANVFIALINLLDDQESLDNGNGRAKRIYECHANNLINDLKLKSKNTCGWERAQFLYLIGYLSYLFYIYRFEYFREARELFERSKQYLNAGRSDQASECIGKSIEFIRKNTVEDISEFDEAIENAVNYLNNNPNESFHIMNTGLKLNALFNKIYLEKIRESETYLADACNVLRCKLDIYKFLNGNLPLDINHSGCHQKLNLINNITTEPQYLYESIEISPPMAAVYVESYRSKQKKKIHSLVDEEIKKLKKEGNSSPEAIPKRQEAMLMCEKAYSDAIDILDDDEYERIEIFVDEFISTLKEINDLIGRKATDSEPYTEKYIQDGEIQMRYSTYVQEYSHLLTESGRLYLKMKKPEIAEKSFLEAIKLLKDRPQDIKRRSLWTLLSRSQSRLLNRRSDALKGAQKGRMANPLGYDERRELGRIFCKLEEYDFGLQELDYAQSWKPDAPEILVEIGRSHLKQARECSDKEHRKKILKNACDRLHQALKIYDKSLIIKRGVARYWLGRVYYEMGDYKKAIPHLRIIYNVRLIEADYDRNTLVIALRLAQAYLKAKLFDDSEELFDKIIAKKIDLDDYNICDTPGEKYEDPISFREVIIKACLGKCISCIERNGDPSLALNNAALARRYLCSSEYPERSKYSCDGTDSKKASSDRLSYLNADYEYCMGRIYSYMSLPCIAVEWLESSVSKRARPYAYLHLALAYESKINTCNCQQEDAPFLVRKALKCCCLADELDLKGEYEMELKELNTRLPEILADKSKIKNEQ
jgi:predicted Zn-dependent protease